MLKINTNFPGGNVKVDKIDDFQVHLSPDLRDNCTGWFYWYFEAEFDAPGSYNFTFPTMIGTRGPAVSYDGGVSWSWLYQENSDHLGFTYIHTTDKPDRVRFCFGIPYFQKNLEQFLATQPNIERRELCRSRHDRTVELLKIGQGATNILLTCRHHCCEMMASYVLEGLMQQAAQDREFQQQATIWVIPFVDKDGVEEGDQGKNRIPYDHARDYGHDKFIYPETRSLAELMKRYRPEIFIDFHCPWIRNGCNENIYIVGSSDPAMQKEIDRWSEQLEVQAPVDAPFFKTDNVRFGTQWNTDENFTQGWPPSLFATKQDHIKTAFCLEVPYANSREWTFTPDKMRHLGSAVYRVMRHEVGL